MGSFSNEKDLTAWVASRTLWIANPDGSGAQPVRGAGAGAYEPMWSADGQSLLYVRDNSLWLIPASGGQAQRIVGPFADPPRPFGFYGFLTWGADLTWHR